ncbi:MAG: YdeI/OmpD-associated family protein [Bacteroidota bacterium]
MEKPLVHKKLKLEKFAGKGGWTYVRLPKIIPAPVTRSGWLKVKGSIDGYMISQYNLAPIGKGGFFFPIKASIRKQIKKQEGDQVEIILFADNDPLEIPMEFIECLRDEPEAYKQFYQFTEAEQKRYIDWIYDSKKTTTRVERMAKAINNIRLGEKPK